MTRFKSAVRGYDKKEVDAYIGKINEHNDKKIHELEECIDRLKQENDYLYAKNAEYRRNEERVSGAILQAMELKGKIERETRERVEQEEDRLLAFKNKWTAYARGINESNADRVVEDLDAYVESFRKSFVKKARRDLNLPSEENSSEICFQKEKGRVERIRRDNEKKEEKMSAIDLFKEEEAAPEPSEDPFREE